MKHAIRYLPAPLPPGDSADLPWIAIPGHDDYADEGEAWLACDELDAAFDGHYVHRVFPANDTESE